MFVMVRQLPAVLIMGIYKAMKSLDINCKMIPSSRIALLTLCAILTGIDLTSGFALRKPAGEHKTLNRPNTNTYSQLVKGVFPSKTFMAYPQDNYGISCHMP